MAERAVVSREATPKPAEIPALQRKCACGSYSGGGSGCRECKKTPQAIQRRPLYGDDHNELPLAVTGLPSAQGHPLDDGTRRAFETRFGHDFGNVRIHSDSSAADAAQSVHAQAYTIGHQIVFGAGRYDPATAAGRSLLAHELTHVVQQRSGRAATGAEADAGVFEQEAERNASLFATSSPLTFVSSPVRLLKRDDESTTTVQAPTGANDCKLPQHSAIAPAIRQSLQWLQRTVTALDTFLSAPASSGSAAVRGSLQKFFKSTSAAVAQRVRDRLELVRTDITSRGDPANPDPQRRQAFTVECHDKTDQTCQVANAYVTPDQNTLVFCPIFFDGFTPEQRAMSIVHEMAHAILGLNIGDRAYNYDRLLPSLSTAEALDNAESYALFTREVGTGTAFESTAPRDEVEEECSPSTERLARVAIARAERWNREANTTLRDPGNDDLLTTHLGNATPATRTAATAKFNAMEDRLRSSIRIACSSENCGTRPAYKRAEKNRRRLGAGIGASIGGFLGTIGGAILGGFLGGVGGAFLGGFLGGAVLAGIGALIGLGIGAAVSREAAINLCPAWAAQPNEGDRVESILAVAYEVYADLGAADGRKYAALARAIHDRNFPPPAP